MTHQHILAFIVASIALIFVVSRLRRKRRTQALESVASQMGFSFVGRKPDFLAALQLPISLLPTGRLNPRAINFMQGTASGMRAAIFDYLHDVRATRAEDMDSTVNHTVAVFASDLHRLPAFNLSRKQWLPFTGEHVQLDNSEFGKHFTLTGSDNDELRRVFGPEVVDMLTSANEREKLHFSGGGPWLVFLAPPANLKTENWPGFVQDMSKIATAIFERAAAARSAAA